MTPTIPLRAGTSRSEPISGGSGLYLLHERSGYGWSAAVLCGVRAHVESVVEASFGGREPLCGAH